MARRTNPTETDHDQDVTITERPKKTHMDLAKIEPVPEEHVDLQRWSGEKNPSFLDFSLPVEELLRRCYRRSDRESGKARNDASVQWSVRKPNKKGRIESFKGLLRREDRQRTSREHGGYGARASCGALLNLLLAACYTCGPHEI